MTQRDVKLTEAQDLQEHWGAFCDSDPFEGFAVLNFPEGKTDEE